jgi:hypothetical protein
MGGRLSTAPPPRRPAVTTIAAPARPTAPPPIIKTLANRDMSHS